jgi:alanyl-tRNA synthetase
MTRLYYDDALLMAFAATVTHCEPAGDLFHVRLDASAFYPTSGGQPHDLGRLGDADVVDVIDDETTGEVVHAVTAPLTVGASVAGFIDESRRRDHMQQHTGQHILSAAFDRLHGVRTVSFHMGAEASTIDLARDVTADELTGAVLAANRVVWDDREVAVRYASDAEAAALPLRKESRRTGVLRLVEVPEFDLSACGGTHVPRTGMIGVIAVTGTERVKGGTRVSFVCGGRALRAFDALRDTAALAARALSVGVPELPEAVARLTDDAKVQQRRVKQLQEQVARQLADELRAAAVPGPSGARLVIAEQPGWDPAALKNLASAVVSEPGLIVVMTGDGQPAPVVVARSADVAFDAGQWLKSALSELGGRGGGRPELAQGGIAAGAAAITAHARETLR